MADPIIEDIKSKVDIVDIIRNYITLKQSGANFKGLCPFHGEKTPSFMVNRERQMYRCFGCGENGDVFAFIMKQENIDFPSALQLLAAKAGVKLPEKASTSKSSTKPGTEKNDLYTVNDLAAKFFHHVLLNHALGKPALDYLLNRGVNLESIKQFQIGFAPTSDKAIQALYAKNNILPQALQLAGAPQRFRNRIMFPLKDVIGNVVGFSGRAMGDAMPKYLNTAETSLFRKNRYLYGLLEAKKNISDQGKIMLVEGQLDLVLSHQAGVNYTVATSGTALTDEHLRLLRRYSDTLHLALDGDSAGRKATERAITLVLEHEFTVSVVPLPEGSDPGDLAAKDAEAWRKLTEKPITAIEWLFSYYFPEARKPNAAERDKITQTLFPYIAMQNNPINQSWALQHLALSLGITQEKVLHDAFAAWQAKSAEQKNPKTSSSKGSQPTETSSSIPLSPDSPSSDTDTSKREKSVIGFLLLHPELLEHKDWQPHEADFTHPTLLQLYKLIHSWYSNTTTQSSDHLLTYLSGKVPKPVYQALQKLVFDTQTLIQDLSTDQLFNEYTFLIRSLRERWRRERIDNFARLIAQAAAKQDTPRVRELMQQMQHIMQTQVATAPGLPPKEPNAKTDT